MSGSVLYAKRPDVALYAIGPIFLSPPPSSSYYILKIFEHGSLCQAPTARLNEHPRPNNYSRVQRCFNALTPDHLEGMVLRGHPIVWSLTLCPEDTKEDPVVHDTEFGVVFLAKNPLIASIQEGLDCLGLYYSGLEGKRYFRLVLEFT